MKQILRGVRVVDLSTGVSGPFCAKMLADQGAEVIKVEPLAGDPARREGPFLDQENHGESSAHFLYLNTNKKSMTLDLGTAPGRAVLDRLLAQADICVESCLPSQVEGLGLSYDSLAALNPRLVVTSITPFGSSGPYRDYRGEEIVYQAMGGFLYLSGEYRREPVQAALNQAQLTAGRYAAFATLAALYHQRRTGLGQHVEASIMEAVAMLPPFHITSYSYAGVAQGRGPDTKNVMDGDYLECQDGYVCLTTGGGNSMEQWALFFDLPQLLDPEYETEAKRHENWAGLDELFHGVLQKQKKHEFMRAAMENRFVVGVVQSPEEVLRCPQIRERDALVEVEHPVAGSYRYPGPGYRADGENPLAGSQPAPLLGQHTAEVLEQLGYTPEERERLRQAGVI